PGLLEPPRSVQPRLRKPAGPPRPIPAAAPETRRTSAADPSRGSENPPDLRGPSGPILPGRPVPASQLAGAGLDRSDHAGFELGGGHGFLVARAVAAERDGAVFDFAFADDEDVGDLLRHGVADLLAHGFTARVELGADHLVAQGVDEFAGVVVEALRDGDDAHLDGGEPGGEGTAVVLDEEGDETLVGPERGAMDDVGPMFGPVGADVREAEPLGDGEVELVGARGLFAAGDGAELDVDLGTIERRLALPFREGQAAALHGTTHDRLGALPSFGIVDVFLLAFGVLGIPGGETEIIITQAQDLIDTPMHVHDGEELVFDLLLGAIDVCVVHAHAADAEEPREGAGVFEAVDVSIFGEA